MSIGFNRKNLLALAIASAAGFGVLQGSAHAALINWNGAAAAAWTTAGSWSPVQVPGINDIAVFDNTVIAGTPGTLTATLTTPPPVGGISVLGTAAVTLSITRGSNLSIDSGGLTVGASAGAVTISPLTAQPATVILTASQTWSNASANVLTINVPVVAGANTLTIGTANTGTINFASGLSGTGGINLQNGTMTAGSGVVIGTPITFGTSTTFGTLDLKGNSFTVDGLVMGSGVNAANQLITNTGTTTRILTVDTTLGSNSFGGTIDNGGGSLTLNTLGLNKIGPNTLTLTGGSNISYTGTTSGTRGTLEFAPDGGSGTEQLGAVAFTSGGIIIQSTVGSGGTAALNFTGTVAPAHTVGATGNFVLAGTGTNSIRVGTTVNTATNLIIGPWLTFGTGASTQYATETLGVIGGFTGASVGTADGMTSATTNYELTESGGTDTVTTSPVANTIRYSGSGETIDTNGNALTVEGILNAGTGTLTIHGTATQGIAIGTQNSAGTFPNELVLNAANADIELSGAFNFNGVANQVITITGPNNVMFNQINNNVAHTLTFDNGSANVGALVIGSSKVLSLNTATATSVTTINNPIADNASGASSVVITGPGTVNLNNATINSSFSGGLTLNSGTLGVSGAGGATLGTGTVTINGGTISGTFVNTSVTDFQFKGNFTTSGALTLGNSLSGGFNSIITLNTPNTTITANGVLTLGTITDGGLGYGFTQAGTSSIVLKGVDTFTGPINILSGSVGIADTSVIGSPYGVNRSNVVNIIGASASFYQGAQNTTIAGFNGAGVWTTNGTSGGNLTLAGSGNYVLTGPGGGSLHIIFTKAGSGTQTFGGSFNASSSQTVDSGTLKLDFSVAGAPTADILYNNIGLVGNTTVGGGTLTLVGSASASNIQHLPSLAVASGASAVKLLDAGNPLALSFGNLTRAAGGTVDFTLPSGTSSATNGVLSTVANTNSIIGGWATVNGTDWAVAGTTTTPGVSWSNAAGGAMTIANGTQANGTGLMFLTAAVTPTGLTAAQLYFVVNQNGSTFNVALTPGGAPVTVAALGSGSAATITGQGNITAYTGYTNFVSTGGTTAFNYRIDPTISGTGMDVVTANETFNSLKINPSGSGQTLTLGSVGTAATLTLTSPGGLLFTGSQDYTIASGGNASTRLTSTELIVQQFSDHNLTIGAIISANVLDKVGPGTLTLTAANQIAQNVNLNQGVLSINNFAALGTNVAANTLVFNGGTLQYATGFTGSNDITTRAGAAIAPVAISFGGAIIDTNGLDVTYTKTFGNSASIFSNGGGGGLTKTGLGTLTINNVGGYNGPTYISGGTLSIGTATAINVATLTGSTPANGAAALTVSSVAGLVPGQSVTGPGIAAGTFIVSIASGTQVNISNGTAASITGSYTFGALTNYGIANGGAASSIGDSTYAADNLVLNGGTLQYTGAPVTTDRLFSVTTTNGGSAIDASGTGSLAFTNPSKLAFFGTTTLTLTGSNTDANTLTPVISDSTGGPNALVMGGLTSVAGVTSVTKSGTGTWVLAGNNTYSGITTITGGGTLALSSAHNNIANSSKITVGTAAGDNSVLDVSGVTNGFVLGGAQTLAGHGIINGNVTTSSGSILAPGNSIGTTHYNNNLTLAAGTVLNYEFSGSSSDLTALTGGTSVLTLPTAAGSVTLNMADLGGMAPGTYQLFTYAGTLAGGNADFNSTFAIGTTPPSVAGDTFMVVDTTPNEIDLVITGTAVPEPASLALLGLGAAGLLMRRRRQA